MHKMSIDRVATAPGTDTSSKSGVEPPHSKMIQAVLFDFNGVIINDERVHLKAYREVLTAENVELTDEDYFASLGMDDVAFVRAAFARVNKPLTDELARDVIDREHALHREYIAQDLP